MLALLAPLSQVLHVNGQLCQFSLSTGGGKFIQAAGLRLVLQTSGHAQLALERQDQQRRTLVGVFPNHF